MTPSPDTDQTPPSVPTLRSPEQAQKTRPMLKNPATRL